MGLHSATTDRLFAASGSLCIVCYDAVVALRPSEPFNEFLLGGAQPGFRLYSHQACITVGRTRRRRGGIISMPSSLVRP